MAKFGLVLVLLLMANASVFIVTDAQSCKACNCQFNNVQVLSQLVQAEVNRAIAGEPLVRFMLLGTGTNRVINLAVANHSTLLGGDRTMLDSITISDSSRSSTSSNNLLAYRPRYRDIHSSGLGVIFINLAGVFPCLEPLVGYNPICRTYSEDDDGFRNGKAIIDAGDGGNNFRIFSTTSNIPTYGIAIQQCPELNTTCFPAYHSLAIACYLPRGACS